MQPDNPAEDSPEGPPTAPAVTNDVRKDTHNESAGSSESMPMGESVKGEEQRSKRPVMRYTGYETRTGWLIKRSGLFGAGSSFTLKKKLRFLILKGSMLACMKHEDDARPVWKNGLQNARIVGDPDKLSIEIYFPHREEEFVAETRQEFDEWLLALQAAANKSIRDYYALVAVLGHGHFGKVLLAKDILSHEKFAVKVIRKDRAPLKSQDKIQREVEIMRLVNHKNVIRLYDLFETSEKLYFVLEYMAGGPLYDVMGSSGLVYTEEHASMIIKDVLQGLEYLHAQNIVHRDVKPDNVLTTSKVWPFVSKLADFGLSNFLTTGEDTLESKVGTPYFCAREVISTQTYGAKADLWSTGVMMYEMLSGRKPFEGHATRVVLQKIMQARYHFPEERWSGISEEAKDLIRRLICIDVDYRLSATEALQHPWIVNKGRSHPIQHDLRMLVKSRKIRETATDTEL